MRAVLDPNVLISAAISPDGAPARTLSAWRSGAFELVVSAELLAELEQALAYPKINKRLAAEDAAAFVDLLRRTAIVADDPGVGLYRSTDPKDDYLLALAEAERAVLVTGDAHLMDLADELPIVSPRDFVESL